MSTSSESTFFINDNDNNFIDTLSTKRPDSRTRLCEHSRKTVQSKTIHTMQNIHTIQNNWNIQQTSTGLKILQG